MMQNFNRTFAFMPRYQNRSLPNSDLIKAPVLGSVVIVISALSPTVSPRCLKLVETDSLCHQGQRLTYHQHG